MREGWEYKKLGDFISEYSVKNRCNEIIPVYSVTNSQGFCKDYFSKEVASQDKSTYKIVPYGCFAYNPSRINVGSVDWQNKEERVIVSPLYNVFSVSENLNQDFLLYFIKSNGTMGIINTLATGTVRLNLKLSMLKEFPITVPPLSDQQSIVEELNTINELIRLKKEQLKDYGNLAQSIFYEMFGDPVVNEKGWEVKKFADLYKLKSGDSLSAKNFVEGEIPVYGGNGISGYHNDFNMDGDFIIIGRVGVYCGNVREVHGKFWLTDNAFQLFYSREIQSPCFIHYLLEILDLHKYANAAAQPVISNLTLKDVEIIIPPLSLQQLFAKRIELIEQQKAEIQSTIADLETLLASRMQYWFD